MNPLATDLGEGHEDDAPKASKRTPMPTVGHYEIVAEPQGFEALREDWDALYDRAAHPYFSQSFAWCRTSWEKVSQPRGRRLHCLVARQESRIVLIWPFVIHRLGPWSVTRPLGPETTEYTSVLVEEGPECDARVAQAWQTLRASCKTDLIALPHVRAGSRLHALLASQTMLSATEIDPTCGVDLTGYDTWQAYEQSLGSDTRRKIARTRRRLAERGTLTFEPVVEAAQCQSAIDWILHQKQERLSRIRRDNPWLDTPEYRDFLIAMSMQDAASGRLIISVLRLDGQIIAADVSRIDRTRVEGINKVFDSAFAAYGLGQMIQEDCLKWTFAQKRDFDFRLGSETYKRHWAKTRCDVVSYAFGRSAWGACHVLYVNAARRASRLRYLVPPSWRGRINAALGRRKPAPH